jgi:membrane-associated phospholipid phosphatase
MYMKKYLILVAISICLHIQGSSQNDSIGLRTDTILSLNEPFPSIDSTKIHGRPVVYKLNLPVDIPLTAVTTGVTLFGFTKIYSKERLTDYFFYGSMPLPVLFLADKKMRKDFPKLATLYLEAMGITGITYVSAVYFGDRYRPYAYNDEAPMDFKLRGGSRNSFFAGHPALVGTATFFMAKTYADYHPDSKLRWVFYTLASAATLTTTFARYYGGRHFPSDLIIGTTLGPLSGILIPHIHKNKDLNKRRTVIQPFFGESSGIMMVHKF